MKIPYKARKWAVEKLGGTMAIPSPCDEGPFHVNTVSCPVTQLRSCVKVDVRADNDKGREQAKWWLMQGIAQLIEEKNLYRMWEEDGTRMPGGGKTMWMEVMVAKPEDVEVEGHG